MIEQTAAQIDALVTRDMIWLSDSSLPQPRVYCPTVAEIRETCRRSRELLRVKWDFPASPPPAAIVDNDDDYPSSDGGDESLVPDANSSVEDLSSSEDESDDDDVLPRRVAWKSPALPRIGTVGAGKGKGPSSVGIALAGTTEWQMMRRRRRRTTTTMLLPALLAGRQASNLQGSRPHQLPPSPLARQVPGPTQRTRLASSS